MMADLTLEENLFYIYLKNNLQENLSRWIEPYWIICIPENSVLKKMESVVFSGAFAASQILTTQDDKRVQYTSELFGSSLFYEISGDDPRSILWQEDNQSEIVISKAIIIKEYLIGFKENVLHVLLTDRLLPSMIEEDQLILPQLPSTSVTSNKEASEFLWRFRCHTPVLEWLDAELNRVRAEVLPESDVDGIQCCLHGLILQSWDFLIKRHLVQIQVNATFQDVLFRALDFYVVGFCHNALWNQVLCRCRVADQLVKARLSYLRSSDISPSQFGMHSDFCAPLPAALVEMASINGRSSAIEMLHCVRDSIEFIQAQTKEAKALLYQFTDTDTNVNRCILNEDEIITLMMVVVVRAQCFNLVANIYYMTHYVFSVTDELHPLWKGLSVLRKSLERIMKLDISRLPPVTHPMRKELSLQDLMLVSAEVESLFESHSQRKAGSQSASDITALDLQLKNLTYKIRQSTEAHSETKLDEENSPSRRAVDTFVPSPPQSFNLSPSKAHNFVEFLSSIPSTIRASFRRRQCEKRSALQAVYSTD